MKAGKSILAGIILITAVLISIQGNAIEYKIFDGKEGYQEIKIERDIYFVSFHGLLETLPTDLEAAWRTRAAEICLKTKSRCFLELLYSFEPVLKSDLVRPGDRKLKVTATPVVFMPIIIPLPPYYSSNREKYHFPTYQGHIRCLRDPLESIKPERLIDVQEIITDAKVRGWITEPKR